MIVQFIGFNFTIFNISWLFKKKTVFNSTKVTGLLFFLLLVFLRSLIQIIIYCIHKTAHYHFFFYLRFYRKWKSHQLFSSEISNIFVRCARVASRAKTKSFIFTLRCPPPNWIELDLARTYASSLRPATRHHLAFASGHPSQAAKSKFN